MLLHIRAFRFILLVFLLSALVITSTEGIEAAPVFYERGDLNLNGLSYELADGYLYRDYFFFGLSAFQIDIETQIVTSDINGDGIYLSLFDFCYMLRVMDGVFTPFPPLRKSAAPISTGIITSINTGQSLIVTSELSDSVGVVVIEFHLANPQDTSNYGVALYPAVDSTDVTSHRRDSSLLIMFHTFPKGNGSLPHAAIDTGRVPILKITYTGDAPSLSHSEGVGFLADPLLLTSRELYHACGDADWSGNLNVLDVAFLINYLYKNGPEPDPLPVVDINGSGNVNVLDATSLVNYLYKNGSAPNCR